MRKAITVITLILLTPVLACAEQKDAGDDELAIVSKPVKKSEEKPPVKASKALDDFFAKKLLDTEFLKEAEEVAALLDNPSLTEDDNKKLVIAIVRDLDRSKKAFAQLLDPHRYPDVHVRLGALKGIETAYAAVIDVGSYVGAAALADPDAKVRRAAIQFIKDLNERGAVKYIFGVLLKAGETGESTAIVNQGMGAQATAALREIGDKQVYEVLLFLERVKMNAGITGPAFLDNPKITPPNTDLPCNTPNHEVGMMESVQTFPGLEALKSISGENFQHDLKKWQEWIDKQPSYKGKEK
jgi:hypothetical protein